MKEFLSLLLICALLILSLTACDRKSSSGTVDEAQQSASFAPEATAITSQTDGAVNGQSGSGNSLADIMDLDIPDSTDSASTADDSIPAAQDVPADAPVVVDATVEPVVTDSTAEPATVAEPFATATPQPNTTVTSYSDLGSTGLGFRLSYPTGWNNIPGRSTVCYVQPMENGTVYPARVAVTMKTLPHKCTDEKAQTELVEYVKLLMSQYDESTFEVSKDLDTETKFMGSKAISTTYLAYDGDQEIQGYIILTWFEKYVFCYHFLCAYEDYAAFDPVMRHIRDSVQPVQSDFEGEDS